MLNRSAQPQLPVGAMLTHGLASPLATHFRPATCAEAQCRAYVEGFVFTTDPKTELGAAQLTYLRNDKSRPQPTVEHLEDGRIRLTYPPGTQPFANDEHENHVVPLERDPIMFRFNGDFRGQDGPKMLFDRPDQWVDDFVTHTTRVREQIERG